MALRCLLFSCDQGAAQLVGQVLADLRIDAESCPDAVTATERVTSQLFQIVIVDWDDQPDAAFLLNTARTRKALERPLTLAIVGNDQDVPKALQAGANSILRKPILVNQVRDTMATARDLLRAKFEQAAATLQSSSPKNLAPPPPVSEPQEEQTRLRAGEFLQSSTPAPSAQFITEADANLPIEQSEPTAQIDPLKELEPMAAAVEQTEEASTEKPPAASEPRGLAWYLKARTSSAAAAPAPALSTSTQPVSTPPELLNFEQTPRISSTTSTVSAAPGSFGGSATSEDATRQLQSKEKENDQQAETRLFAYMEGDRAEVEQAPARAAFSWSGGRVALVILAVVVAAVGIAYWKLPQNIWKPQLQQASKSVVAAGHTWLNPQPVTPAQAPPSHESFSRAGDEYKLPAPETSSETASDSSQIQVVPVIDPTTKKVNAPADPNLAPDASSTTTGGESQPTTGQQNQPPAPAANASAPSEQAIQAISRPSTEPAATTPTPPAVASTAAVTSSVPSAAQHNAPPNYTTVRTGIPSSLKSQMASMTPEASGNKLPESALPSIEPVSVPEATERNLLIQQPAPAYPDAAKGQSGTVVLQVLVGRDGTVQDAKFLQGSLAFVRSAIDTVKQWRFQPYVMNGRPVSVVTSITLNFKPGP